MTLFLLGFMGAGKTFWGEKLADHLGRKFVDTDELIIQSEQMPINDIFRLYGERYFRELEKKLINEFSETNEVVSVGGGLPVYNQNMSTLNQKGITIFIDESFDICYERIKNTERPLAENVSQFILHELYKKRLPIYKESKLTISSPKRLKDFTNLLH